MDDELAVLRGRPDVPAWRWRLAEHVESARVQRVVVAVILVNAVLLGLETVPAVMDRFGAVVRLADLACLAVFTVELVAKLVAYGRAFWRSGWRVFDLLVVGIALVPGAGPWAVLRALRVLRVLRLLTVVPALRRVVAAFLHAIPGLVGVMAVMGIFFYTAAVLATELFGESFPEWFGGIGPSLYTLFQVMTLESWSMGIVRPVMEVYPGAWGFFVPFIVIATFTILNLFIGIIVSTMQELALAPDEATQTGEGHATGADATDATHGIEATGDRLATVALLDRLEADVAELRTRLAHHDERPAPPADREGGASSARIRP